MRETRPFSKKVLLQCHVYHEVSVVASVEALRWILGDHITYTDEHTPRSGANMKVQVQREHLANLFSPKKRNESLRRLNTMSQMCVKAISDANKDDESAAVLSPEQKQAILNFIIYFTHETFPHPLRCEGGLLNNFGISDENRNILTAEILPRLQKLVALISRFSRIEQFRQKNNLPPELLSLDPGIYEILESREDMLVEEARETHERLSATRAGIIRMIPRYDGDKDAFVPSIVLTSPQSDRLNKAYNDMMHQR